VVRHAVTSHRQISGNAVTSAFTAIHPVLNRNQRRYHVKTIQLILYREIIFVGSEVYTKHFVDGTYNVLC
jgi:hypothetical protein